MRSVRQPCRVSIAKNRAASSARDRRSGEWSRALTDQVSGFEVSSSRRGLGPGRYDASRSPRPALEEGLAARSEPSSSASRNARKSRRKCESRRKIAGKSSSRHAVSGLSSTSTMRWINDSMSSYTQVTCGPNLNELRAVRGVVEFARWATRHRLVEALRIGSVRIRAFPLEADGEPRGHTDCTTIAGRTSRTPSARSAS